MGRLRKKIRQLLWDNFSGRTQAIKLTIIYSVPFIAIFTALIISLVLWEAKKHGQEQTEEFLESARSFHKQVMVEKKWMEQQGGFFVPGVNGDDATAVGKRDDQYRRIDFASVLNGQSEIAGRTEGYRFHIVSPDASGNYHHPDGWETNALGSLESGAPEVFSISEADGGRYFRYMSRFPEDAGMEQAGTDNDPITAIAITIPTAFSDLIHKEKMKRDIISYGTVGIISLVFIILLIWRFSRKISSVIDRELEEKRLKALVELAGAAAHEIRQPLAVIIGFSDLLKQKTYPDDGQISDTMTIIKDQCNRINGIVSKMLRISQYKTIPYIDDIRIFDLNSVDNTPSKN